eukprot:COSAG04_NODE_2651_length_3787_cov_2.405471_1_plen_187_part_10
MRTAGRVFAWAISKSAAAYLAPPKAPRPRPLRLGNPCRRPGCRIGGLTAPAPSVEAFRAQLSGFTIRSCSIVCAALIALRPATRVHHRFDARTNPVFMHFRASIGGRKWRAQGTSAGPRGVGLQVGLGDHSMGQGATFFRLHHVVYCPSLGARLNPVFMHWVCPKSHAWCALRSAKASLELCAGRIR